MLTKHIVKSKRPFQDNETRKIFLKIISAAIFLSLFDQVLKLLAKNYLQKEIVLNPFISLRYEKNYGIAWSIPFPGQLLLITNILLILLLPVFCAHYLDLNKKETQFLVALVFGGAFGNFLDRILHGYVADYLAIGWWPVFNLADAALSIGIFLICLFYGKIKKKS